MSNIKPTYKEIFFEQEQIIVSKTDLSGKILYANPLFIELSGYRESEIIGKPHSIIRHPDMPRCVFKLLWDTIESGNEIFAYVMNMSKNGDHYWVLAHVTPSYDNQGKVVGYHSNRRCPEQKAVKTIDSIYRSLREEELRHNDKRKGLASFNPTYDQLSGSGKKDLSRIRIFNSFILRS